jgi:hypothetical protein
MQTPPRPPPAPLVPPPAPRRPRAAAGVAGPAGVRVLMPPLVFGNGSPPGGGPARSRKQTRKQKQQKRKQTRKQKQQKN